MRIPADVLTVLSDAIGEGNGVYLPYQLDKNLYTKVNRVLTAAGGRWNRSQAAHLFAADVDVPDLLDALITTGRVAGPWDTGYFPTPEPVFERLRALAALDQPGMRILEPSAGRGAIALPLARAGHRVDCVELVAGNADALTGQVASVRVADFLTLPATPHYDRVLMNPPFAKQAYVHHTVHAHAFLAPGGRLVAVLPNAVTYRTDRVTRTLTDLIESTGGTVHPLPEGSFETSGTGVHTVLAVLNA